MENNIFNRQKRLFRPCLCLILLLQLLNTACKTTKTAYTGPEQKWVVIAETLPGTDLTQLPRFQPQKVNVANNSNQVYTVTYKVEGTAAANHLKNELERSGLVTQVRTEQYNQQSILIQ